MMKQFKNIFRFELTEMFQKNSIRITTVIICLLVFGATFIPPIFNEEDEIIDDPNPPVQEVLPMDHLVFVLNDVYSQEELEGALGTSIHILTTLDEAKQSVESKEYEKAVMFASPTEYQLIANDLGSFDTDELMLTSIITELAKIKNFKDKGIDPQEALEALNFEVKVDYQLLGKSSTQGFFFAYVIMFVLYMLILFFGQSVSTSIAREKDSRTMELLITSTSTKDLILGKVMAMGVLGIAQMSLIIISGLIGFVINKGNYPEMLLHMFKTSLSLDVIIVYILFSALGYILYLFIFAALGSLVSKVEDVGGAITPITLLFVVAFMIASFALQLPNSSIVVISSFIPFVSLFTMPIRYMLTTVEIWHLAISLGLMAITVVLIEKLSIYIYRFGSLNYGNKIKIREIIRSFK